MLVVMGVVAGPGNGAVQASGSQVALVDTPRAMETMALGINDRGDIVGVYFIPQGRSSFAHGFLLRDGRYTTLDYPKATNTIANGINDRGDVVGTYNDGTRAHGFRWRDGRFTTLDRPRAADTMLVGINQHGAIVGMSDTSTGRPSAFVLHAHRYTALNHPRACAFCTDVSGINQRGDVVGTYYDSKVHHAFLWHQGRYTTFDQPNGSTEPYTLDGTSLSGINQQGDVVGSYWDNYGVAHGFLWHQGSYIILDHPGAGTVFDQGTQALGVNDHGDIVGTYDDGKRIHGFLWRDGRYTTISFTVWRRQALPIPVAVAH
jgi:probable HAF family extracellular repeat protein